MHLIPSKYVEFENVIQEFVLVSLPISKCDSSIQSIYNPTGDKHIRWWQSHRACAAGLAVLEVIENEHLIENAANVGGYLMEQLVNFEGVREVRGRGLMIGIEFDFPTAGLRKRLLYEEKVFVGSASNANVTWLLSPLSLSKKEADLFLGKTLVGVE